MREKRHDDGDGIITTKQGMARRQFLRGAGGFALALPFLGSLLVENGARGVFTRPKRFVALVTDHGGVWPENMYPADATAPTSTEMLPGWDVHSGPLSLQSAGTGQVQLSRCLRASSSALTPTIASKTNLIQGLNVPFFVGHTTGVPLGNFIECTGGSEAGGLSPRPTVDQVMAWSESFYPSGAAGVTKRSIHIGRNRDRNIAWNYSNPSAGTGDVIAMPNMRSSVALFEQLFPGHMSEPTETRPLVVDRVAESYGRLREGRWGNAARLSSQDRTRLSEHMERLYELERRLGAAAGAASCGDVQRPMTDADDAMDDRTKWSLYNDLVVAAFVCGTSRIATLFPATHWYPGVTNFDWHQEVAHRSDEAPPNDREDMMVESHRNFFEHVFLDLAQKLDVDEGDGTTYLDNSLLMFTMESGPRTHDSTNVPVVTIGSAGGYLNTGRYLDYRNRVDTSMSRRDFLGMQERPGASYNQWLANVLLSMGVDRAEWERPGERGYGGGPDFGTPLMQQASDPLPFLAA